jgi:MFS family permease
VPFFYVAQFAEEKIHTSASRAFDIIAVLNAGSVLGRPISGLFADALGRYNLIVPCATISGILCLTVWILSDDFASITAFAAFYGFFSGAVISLTRPCIVQISQLPQIGRRVGLAYTMMSFS